MGLGSYIDCEEGLQESAQAFMNSNLRFTMLPGGAVKYDRLPVAGTN